jgi:hypothetical protein
VVPFNLAIRACRRVEDPDRADVDSLLLHWENGEVVAVPTVNVFRLVLLALIDSGNLEGGDAMFRKLEKLFSSGELDEGANGPALTKLYVGRRHSNQSSKKRALSLLEAR